MNTEQILQLFEPFLLALLSALAGVLTAYIIKLLRQQFSQAQWQMIERVVALAVASAEQYGGDNEMKKRTALAMAQEVLVAHGIHLNLNEIDAVIEAAVWREIKRERSANE